MTTAEKDIASIEAIIPPIPKTLTIQGVEIPIRQMKLGQLPIVLRAIQPIAGILMSQEGNPNSRADIPQLFLHYSGDCLNVISALSGQSKAWVDELEIDEGVQLLSELLEVNIAFFVQRVLPLLLGEAQNLKGIFQTATQTAGQTSSKS
jgi:hypothetical protein